jgi:5,10-methylenetetrahydromethanopterin reductase
LVGLAARGEVSDVLARAEEARGRGIDSIWVHDSYFERDAVTYGSALAANVDGIGIGLGALNPFTRHPVVLAMTVSALDEMAPGRVMLGLGTGRGYLLSSIPGVEVSVGANQSTGGGERTMAER